MSLVHRQPEVDDVLNNTAQMPAGKTKQSKVLHMMAMLMVVALTCVASMVGFTSVASAGTNWQSTGYTGTVVEPYYDGYCYNLNPYSIAAAGPTIYGFTGGGNSTEIAMYNSRLYDATTGTVSAWSGFSQGYYVTASAGVNWNAQRDVFRGVHSHNQYVQIYVVWLNVSGTAILGTKAYLGSNYANPYDYGGHAASCYN